LMTNVAGNQFNSLLEEHEEVKNLPHKAVNFIQGMFYVAASYGLDVYLSWYELKKGDIKKLNGRSDIDVIREDWKKKIANYSQEIKSFPDSADRVMSALRNQILAKFKEDFPGSEELPHKVFEAIEDSLINIMLWSFWIAEVEGDHYRK
jgi:hypothetical protein